MDGYLKHNKNKVNTLKSINNGKKQKTQIMFGCKKMNGCTSKQAKIG